MSLLMPAKTTIKTLPEKGFLYLENFIRKQDAVVPPGDTLHTALAAESLNISTATAHKIEQSFFQEKSQQADIKPRKIESLNNDILGIALLGFFVSLALFKSLYYRKLLFIYRFFFSHKQTGLLSREGSLYAGGGYYVLLFFSILSISLLIYVTAVHKMMLQKHDAHLFLYIFLGVFSFLAAKTLFVYFIAHLFGFGKIFQEYFLLKNVFIIIAGFVSLFAGFLLVYVDFRMTLTPVLLALLLISAYFIVRLFLMLRLMGYFKLFYFFLYICSVEIMPLLAVYKLYIK